MLNLSNYQAIERIHESDSTIVYQGRRISDNLPVIIKLPKSDYPAPEESARYSHEFKILSSLDLDGVIKAVGLELYDNRRGIILEDFGGTALSKLMLRHAFSVQDFLSVAIKTTKALLAIHSSFIIHKDVNPSNIVLNEDSGQLKLIDFGISSELSHEASNHGSIQTMEGTLAYTSPEQTGRMNRTLDYRTDFYSLGVTLYEIICRRLPFISDDVLELVHAHIAKNPIPPCQLRPDLPPQISDVIMRLLQKNADERYQSAGGLLLDLEECSRQWEAFGRINGFPLARHDLSDRLNVGQKLYGRETEINSLLEAYDRVAKGGREAFLVSGAAGLGKSSMVREASKNILFSGACFVSGKFDQLNDGVPYKALLDAFQELIKQILCEDEPKLIGWRNILQNALLPNGALLIAVIPELEQIIGAQPAVPKLPPLEAQNRFRLVFQNFIKAFCRPQQPLVIFLDDLQWGGRASYDLLKHIMTDPSLKHLLLISAFRETEVDAIHPLTACLNYWDKEEVAVTRIALEVLGVDHIGQLLADSLSVGQEEASPLADLLWRKTGGNPFFIGMFLHSLYRDNLLWIDKTKEQWQWDLGKIQTVSITENVVTLLSDKISRLLPETQQTLQLAGTLGNKFDLQLLSILVKKPMSDTVSSLQEAVDEGLIVPFGDTYKLIGLHDRDIVKGDTVYFRFLHDRIQKVAYSLLSEQKRQEAHYTIGRHLLRELTAEQQSGQIFHIVNHLNKAGGFVHLQEEKDKLALLNLKAALKAKNSAAWHVAFKHTRLAIALLGGESWEREYALTLELHIEGAESAYLCAEFEAMAAIVQAVIDKGRTLLDQVRIYEVKIQAYKARYQLMLAIETALPVLAMLGFKFPMKPSKMEIALGLQRVKLALLGKDIEQLAELPEMNDPKIMAAIRIMNSVGSAAYFVAPELTPLLIFTAIRLIIKHGNVPESAFLFAVYGMISCGVLGEIDEGYRLGQLALRLLHFSEVRELKAKTIHMVNAFTLHWKNSLRTTLPPLLDGYQVGLESGDNEYAGYCAFFYCSHAFLAGSALADLDQEMAAFDKAIVRLQYSPCIYGQKIFHQTVVNLRQKSYKPGLLQGDIYDEQLESSLHVKATDQLTLFFLNFTKLYLSYLFHDFSQTATFASQAEAYLDGAVGSVFVPLFYYYDSLARLAVAVPDTSGHANSLEKVAANQKKMKRWAKHAPMNYRHKYLLVEAERLRVLGQDSQAGEQYDQAITLAQENEYLNDEALANELAARFYLNKDRKKIAGAYMQEARYCFLQWGATAKVSSLDEEYRDLLPVELISRQTTDKNLVAPVGSTAMASDAEFDLASVMKVSQAISGEIVLGNLLQQMMKIVIENAGAQFGYLIMKSGDKLLIEAEGALDSPNISVLQSIPLEECHTIAAGIVHYVDRTREYVVLENAFAEGHFTHDAYVVQHKPKSILCLPLIHKSNCIGILYLENDAIAGAFTLERLKMLRLLSSQIAISLENANLFADLENSETRYRELYENIIDIVLLVSSEGIISMANPLFYSLFGLHREETRAMNLKKLVHPDDMAMLEERLLVRLNTADVVKDLQFRMVGLNKEVFEVECNAKCIRSHNGSSGSIQMVVRDVSDRKRLERDLFDSLKDAQNAKKGTILGLAKLAEYRDKDTGSHLERIREYARVITEELSTAPEYKGYISQRYIDDIYLSSILHDIGKVGIPDRILLKTGSLTGSEFDEMKRHPIYGGDALSAVESQVAGESFIALGKTIAYYHHEKWDGTGYPYGLRGEDIPLSTRIVALVDVYDALTSKRSYKDAFSHEKAKEIIFEGKGKHFAPDVVDAFLVNENRFLAIREELLN